MIAEKKARDSVRTLPEDDIGYHIAPGTPRKKRINSKYVIKFENAMIGNSLAFVLFIEW
jgi:hypothetical protein